uniref:Bestrophin homolog n=1 Tax=Romanomermis culicivorax TaxID=13658 RepID=A0A915JZK5_ROMCU
MTLSYGGNYFSTLLRWKGGLLRSLWKEMIVYFFVFFLARLTLQHGGRTTAHDGVVYAEYIRIFRNYVEKVPIHVLVTVLAASTLFRWHKIVRQLNFPDYLMMLINANLPGTITHGFQKFARISMTNGRHVSGILMFSSPLDDELQLQYVK